MHNYEKVSVLMSTYNEPLDWIREAVDSILNQTYPNIEFIIIVDKPDNRELILLLEEYKKENNNIVLIINEKNLGLVESLNKGIQCATGEYIARMDADDISESARIEKQVRYLKENSYNLVGSYFTPFWLDNRKHVCVLPKKDGAIRETFRHRNCVQHPTWLGEKKVFIELNGYRNIDACEDFDFLVRVALTGYRLGNVGESLLLYRLNPLSISHQKLYKQQATMLYISYNYRHNKVITMDEYNKYLNSSKYRQKCKRLAKMDFYNRSVGLRHLIVFFIPEYISWKISNLIINRVRLTEEK